MQYQKQQHSRFKKEHWLRPEITFIITIIQIDVVNRLIASSPRLLESQKQVVGREPASDRQ